MLIDAKSTESQQLVRSTPAELTETYKNWIIRFFLTIGDQQNAAKFVNLLLTEKRLSFNYNLGSQPTVEPLRHLKVYLDEDSDIRSVRSVEAVPVNAGEFPIKFYQTIGLNEVEYEYLRFHLEDEFTTLTIPSFSWLSKFLIFDTFDQVIGAKNAFIKNPGKGFIWCSLLPKKIADQLKNANGYQVRCCIYRILHRYSQTLNFKRNTYDEFRVFIEQEIKDGRVSSELLIADIQKLRCLDEDLLRNVKHRYLQGENRQLEESSFRLILNRIDLTRTRFFLYWVRSEIDFLKAHPELQELKKTSKKYKEMLEPILLPQTLSTALLLLSAEERWEELVKKFEKFGFSIDMTFEQFQAKYNEISKAALTQVILELAESKSLP